MLTNDETREMEEALQHYPDKRAGAIDALLLLQRRRGWISDESLADIAEFLNMTRDDIDGVATFYNLIFREPIGRHVLFMCDSISCWVMGCERVQEQLERRYEVNLGQTTGDGRLTILPIACLGHCERAPAIMLDADVYGNVTSDNVESIVEKYK